MSTKKTGKLAGSKSYKRPKTTIQEKFTEEEIADKLRGYRKAKKKDLIDTPLGTHIRYFTKKDGKHVFRTGGTLKVKKLDDGYIILGTDAGSWSVQLSDSIIFVKMSHRDEVAELEKYYQEEIAKRDAIIKKLKKKLKSLQS
jgi:hypothetical protein